MGVARRRSSMLRRIRRRHAASSRCCAHPSTIAIAMAIAIAIAIAIEPNNSIFRPGHPGRNQNGITTGRLQ